MEWTFDSSAVFEVISVLAIVVILLWRMPSKGDIERIDNRIDKLDTDLNARIDKLEVSINERFEKVDERFEKTDGKIDDTRKEAKADLARLEDRMATSNGYQARIVELLDAIRRELEERREPL